MKEIDIVYSNPIKIDNNTIQVDKTCKVLIDIGILFSDKDTYESNLIRINKMINKIQSLLD